MSAGIMIPLYAAAPTLCSMVVTYASVIKADPLPIRLLSMSYGTRLSTEAIALVLYPLIVLMGLL
jgi:hypothetical protein